MPAAPDNRIASALQVALDRGELGVQVAAYLGDELIVDAAAGIADADSGRAVDRATLFPVFSVTKAVTATALQIQVERGLLDVRDRVSDHWPEFAAHGKDAITVRQLLSHRAGVPWMPEDVTPERQGDWAWMVRQIEQMAPTYPAGTTNCYHALVWGWMVGELVRRVDPEGRDFAGVVRAEITGPLGIEDLHFGLPPTPASRMAVLVGGGLPASSPPLFLRGMPAAVLPSAHVYNSPVVRAAVNPAAGVITTAGSMARFFSMLAGGGAAHGVRLLSSERVESFMELRDDVEAPDHYLGVSARVSASGYRVGGGMLVDPVIGAGSRVLYHPGAGGSIAWADLDTGLAVAICHNAMHGRGAPTGAAHPFAPIADAVRAVAADPLGAPG